MNRFWSMFATRSRYRHYARLDHAGVCRALKHCADRPTGAEWVEVTDQNLTWLNQPLPAHARIGRQPARQSPRRLLTA